jgi:hypothetical protein
MNELFVMRRANGTLYIEDIDRKLRLPIWSSREAVMRYKERNPELSVFIPQRFDRELLERLAANDTEASPDLFLLSDDDPDADLADGRPVTLEEILSDPVGKPHPAEAQA